MYTNICLVARASPVPGGFVPRIGLTTPPTDVPSRTNWSLTPSLKLPAQLFEESLRGVFEVRRRNSENCPPENAKPVEPACVTNMGTLRGVMPIALHLDRHLES